MTDVPPGADRNIGNTLCSRRRIRSERYIFTRSISDSIAVSSFFFQFYIVLFNESRVEYFVFTPHSNTSRGGAIISNPTNLWILM